MANGVSKKRDKIIIRGARINNLKNIDVDIPRDKLVVITGLSGSGKSSLAFDVVYAEGNRRYLEGMSSYARQFLDVGAKPDVDKIENLSPTISIDQRSLSRSSRSTVGTLTEIYDYLRILFAKIGVPHCPKCGEPMIRKSSQEIIDEILTLPDNTQIAVLAKIKEDGKNSKEILRNIIQLGFARVRFNGKIMLSSEAILIASEHIYSEIEVVVDRLFVKQKSPDKERILDSIETAFKIGRGTLMISVDGSEDRYYNQDFLCRTCQTRINEITPHHFSFNNPEGACALCSGLGIIKEVDADLVMPNKNLTLAEGALLPLSKSNGRLGGHGNYLNILRALGEQYNFSVDTPVKKLSEEVLDIVFYGSGGREVTVKQRDAMGGLKEVKVAFEGVVPMLKRKYAEAASEYVRSDLEKYLLEKICPTCAGKRLKDEYLSVLINGKSIDDVVNLNLIRFEEFLDSLKLADDAARKEIALPLIREMSQKNAALKNVGLEYLSLSRGANSISGGEAQRIRLATQIGSELMGITYILDEPSIGLHNRDTEKLVKTMQALKESGNSLLVVEHDSDIIKKADWIIDMGPGAGEEGGRIIFEGDLKKMLKSNTATAQYLTGKKKVVEKKNYRKGSRRSIEILGAEEHNLKNIDVEIPLGKFVGITGVKHFFGAK
jgi:excinuclease ABC subunit A